MILRSVMRHVRDQNWVAVGLDFLIVVAGVFIGIQVSNWNDERQSQAELAAALGNLAQEISNTAARRAEQIEYQDRALRGYRHMLDLLDGAKLNEEELETAYQALRLGLPPPAPSRYETLYELQSTGRLKDIPSRELRGALGELLSNDRIRGRYAEMWASTVTAPPFSTRIVTYDVVEQGSSNTPVLVVIDVDLEQARNAPDFRARIAQMLALYSISRHSDETWLRMDRIVLEMLQSEGYRPSGNWLEENRERLVPGLADDSEPSNGGDSR